MIDFEEIIWLNSSWKRVRKYPKTRFIMLNQGLFRLTDCTLIWSSQEWLWWFSSLTRRAKPALTIQVKSIKRKKKLEFRFFWKDVEVVTKAFVGLHRSKFEFYMALKMLKLFGVVWVHLNRQTIQSTLNLMRTKRNSLSIFRPNFKKSSLRRTSFHPKGSRLIFNNQNCLPSLHFENLYIYQVNKKNVDSNPSNLFIYALDNSLLRCLQ